MVAGVHIDASAQFIGAAVMSVAQREHENMLVKEMSRLIGDERGLLSLANATLALFLTGVVVCAFNVCAALHDRTDAQQKADAIAVSLGNWKARHLNAVTAHQHLVGQLLSLTIVHHAVGGEELDDGRAADTERADNALRAAYLGAMACERGTPAYSDVSSTVRAGAALLAGNLKLKRLLTQVYIAKALAIAMKAYPPTRAAGESLEIAAHAVELQIHREWKVLNRLAHLARSLSPLKQQLLSTDLPNARLQLDRIIEDYPRSQAELARYLSSRLQVEAHVLQSDQRLPVTLDPLARLTQPPPGWTRPVDCDCPSVPADNMRHQLAKVSQLSRATFPWVNYHRKPIVDALKSLAPLSEVGDAYFDFTCGFSKEFADQLQVDGGLALYVIDDYAGPDKALEPWTQADGSHHADRTFGISVVVGTQTRKPIGSFLFRPIDAPYSYRLATAMVWNRHGPKTPPQRIDLTCKRIVPSVQAQTGWDLLNWQEGIEVSELVGIGVPHTFPAIELQWTSNLTPTTAARVDQWQIQPLPDWASDLPNSLPEAIDPSLIAL